MYLSVVNASNESCQWIFFLEAFKTLSCFPKHFKILCLNTIFLLDSKSFLTFKNVVFCVRMILTIFIHHMNHVFQFYVRRSLSKRSHYNPKFCSRYHPIGVFIEEQESFFEFYKENQRNRYFLTT